MNEPTLDAQWRHLVQAVTQDCTTSARRVYAQDLRAAGVSILEEIPDCAWVLSSDIQIKTEVPSDQDPDSNLLNVDMVLTFSAPFQWVDASFQVTPKDTMINTPTILPSSQLMTKGLSYLWDGRSEVRGEDGSRKTAYICVALYWAYEDQYRAYKDQNKSALALQRVGWQVARDAISKILGTGRVFTGRLALMGVSQELISNSEWVQLRRREAMCMMVSRLEREEPEAYRKLLTPSPSGRSYE